MENKDSILIRKYITLMESIDKKQETKTEEPLNEQLRMFQDLVKTLARTVEVEKALWQTLKTEIPAIGNRFKSAAEFKAAAEAGKITSVESAEIVKYAIKNVPEVAIKMKGLLRLQPEFKEIARQVFPNGTQMLPNASKLKLAQETMAKFGVEAKEAEDMATLFSWMLGPSPQGPCAFGTMRRKPWMTRRGITSPLLLRRSRSS